MKRDERHAERKIFPFMENPSIMPTNSIITFNLNQKIQPGLVTLGKYENEMPNLTLVSNSNKIFIYDLQHFENKTKTEDNVRTLNFPNQITSIGTARFKDDDFDLLLVCTVNRIFVYNVHQNQDVFTKELSNGGHVVQFGMVGTSELVLVGGNYSVQGFDKTGVEIFWIVTGDDVRSLALIDVDNDGENELVVGSDDYDIRIFKNEDLVHEITETQIVTFLVNVGKGKILKPETLVCVFFILKENFLFSQETIYSRTLSTTEPSASTKN